MAVAARVAREGERRAGAVVVPATVCGEPGRAGVREVDHAAEAAAVEHAREPIVDAPAGVRELVADGEVGAPVRVEVRAGAEARAEPVVRLRAVDPPRRVERAEIVAAAAGGAEDRV